MRRQVQDDLSKWEMNAAGDPESQADSRSRAHELAKILKASTPLVLPECRITKSFEAGSQEYPYVPCPHCDEMQVLEWQNMHAALDPTKPEEAHFTCIACGASIEEHHRRQMLERHPRGTIPAGALLLFFGFEHARPCALSRAQQRLCVQRRRVFFLQPGRRRHQAELEIAAAGA
jgi:hypothetical protein